MLQEFELDAIINKNECDIEFREQLYRTGLAAFSLLANSC